MNNNLHKVKVKGTWETRICCRSSFPFKEGVEHNAHMKPTRATLFLLTISPMQDVVIHYTVALKAATEPLQYKVGAISTT